MSSRAAGGSTPPNAEEEVGAGTDLASNLAQSEAWTPRDNDNDGDDEHGDNATEGGGSPSGEPPDGSRTLRADKHWWSDTDNNRSPSGEGSKASSVDVPRAPRGVPEISLAPREPILRVRPASGGGGSSVWEDNAHTPTLHSRLSDSNLDKRGVSSRRILKRPSKRTTFTPRTKLSTEPGETSASSAIVRRGKSLDITRQTLGGGSLSFSRVSMTLGRGLSADFGAEERLEGPPSTLIRTLSSRFSEQAQRSKSLDLSRGDNRAMKAFQFQALKERVRGEGLEGRPLDIAQLTNADTSKSCSIFSHEPWFFPDPPYSVLYEGRLPDGDSFLRWWDVILVMALIYLGLATPLEFAFQDKGQGCTQDLTFVIDILVDIVFVADMMFQFKTAYYGVSPHGKIVLIDDGRQIAKHYAQTTLSLDVVAQLSMFGSYASCFVADLDVKLHYLFLGFSLLRMARLHRVGRLKKIFTHRLRLGGFFFTMFQLTVFIMGLCHYQACIWFIIGKQRESNGTEGWAFAEGFENVTYASDLLSQTYVASLYWSVVTVTGTGYGDYTGTTLYERIYCMIVMITGGFMLSVIIGNIGHMIRNADRTHKFKEVREEVVEYLHSRGVSEGLVANVLRFYDLKYPNKVIYDEDKILNNLPKGLADKIKLQCYSDVLATSGLLQGCSDTTVADMCARLHTLFLSTGDILLEAGDSAERGIFFVRHGTLTGTQHGQFMTQYTEGNPVGVLSTLGLTCAGAIYMETVVAEEECELLQISREDFLNMIRLHQDLEHSMDVMIQMRLLLVERTLASERGIPNDGMLLAPDSSIRGEVEEFNAAAYLQWLESLSSDEIDRALLEAANMACSMSTLTEALLREEALEVLVAQETAKPLMVNVIIDKAVGLPKCLAHSSCKLFVKMALHGPDVVYLPYRQTKSVHAIKVRRTSTLGEDIEDLGNDSPENALAPDEAQTCSVSWSEKLPLKLMDESVGRTEVHLQVWQEQVAPNDVLSMAFKIAEAVGKMQPISWSREHTNRYHDSLLERKMGHAPGQGVGQYIPATGTSHNLRDLDIVDDLHHNQQLRRSNTIASQGLRSAALSRRESFEMVRVSADQRPSNLDLRGLSRSETARPPLTHTDSGGLRQHIVRSESVGGGGVGRAGGGSTQGSVEGRSGGGILAEGVGGIVSKAKSIASRVSLELTRRPFAGAFEDEDKVSPTVPLAPLSTGLASGPHQMPEFLVGTAIVPVKRVWEIVDNDNVMVPLKAPAHSEEDKDKHPPFNGNISVGFSTHAQTDQVRTDSVKVSLLRQEILHRRQASTAGTSLASSRAHSPRNHHPPTLQAHTLAHAHAPHLPHPPAPGSGALSKLETLKEERVEDVMAQRTSLSDAELKPLGSLSSFDASRSFDRLDNKKDGISIEQLRRDVRSMQDKMDTSLERMERMIQGLVLQQAEGGRGSAVGHSPAVGVPALPLPRGSDEIQPAGGSDEIQPAEVGVTITSDPPHASLEQSPIIARARGGTRRGSSTR